MSSPAASTPTQRTPFGRPSPASWYYDLPSTIFDSISSVEHSALCKWAPRSSASSWYADDAVGSWCSATSPSAFWICRHIASAATWVSHHTRYASCSTTYLPTFSTSAHATYHATATSGLLPSTWN